MDPCNCEDVLNFETGGDYFFHEKIKVEAAAGLSMVIDIANSAAIYDNAGNALAGTISFVETSAGVYEYDLWVKKGEGYTVTVDASNGTTATVSNTCDATCNTTYAENDVNQTPENTPVDGNVLTNDNDPEGHNQTVNTSPLEGPTNGTVTLHPNGTYTYTPNPGFVGVDIFVYEVCDDGSPEKCDTAQVEITVFGTEDPINNPPVGIADHHQTNVNTPITGGNLIGNDSDPDFDNITINPTPVTPPNNGTVTINPDGTYDYTPNNDFVGIDTFYYEICDDGSPVLCDTTIVTIEILENGGGNTTYANDDAEITVTGTSVNGNVLDNDFDPEGHVRHVTGVTDPTNGSLVLNDDGTYTYVPNPGYVGNDFFVYQACDEGTPMACDTATAYFSIIAPPSPPSISGYVWTDSDADGQQDGNEPPIPDVPVYLYTTDGVFLGQTTTGADGMYSFTDIAEGDYFVSFVGPEDNTITGSNIGNDATDSDVDGSHDGQAFLGGETSGTIHIGIGTQAVVDAGYVPCIKIGDKVWYDSNMNDIWDSVENGIDGLVVNLYKKEGSTWVLSDTQYTRHKPGTPSDDGWYEFCAVPGTYYVEIVLPPDGLVPAVAHVGSNELIDSDIDHTHGWGTTNHFTLTSGQSKLDIGAGYYPMATVAGRVWNDENGDGIKDDSEPVVSGVLLRAYNNEGEEVGSSVTNNQGQYEIDYLQRADYFLKVSPPSGYGVTAANQGEEQEDSDVDHSNGPNTTTSYHFEPNFNLLYIDAGLVYGALPIAWDKVSAINKGTYNEITWSTLSELNTDVFEVEVRYEEDENFEKFVESQAKGFSNELVRYSVRDEQVEREGVYYYRVKSIDKDGKVSYSDEVSAKVRKGGLQEVTLYPNPTVSSVQIAYELLREGKVIVRIQDLKGASISKVIFEKEGIEGYHNDKIDLGEIPEGVYLLNIDLNGTVYNKRLILLKD